MTKAEIPAPTVIGVQSVVVRCDVDGSVDPVQRTAICRQLLSKTAAVSPFPVQLATDDRTVPLVGANSKFQLNLHFAVRAADVEAGRKSLSIAVTADRPMADAVAEPAASSTAALVRVQNDWILQGPIPSLESFFPAGGKRPPYRPIASEI